MQAGGAAEGQEQEEKDTKKTDGWSHRAIHRGSKMKIGWPNCYAEAVAAYEAPTNGDLFITI